MKKAVRFLICAAMLAAAAQGQSRVPWEIGPFTRPASGNPVIAPLPSSTFIDPILKTPVHWEALHTFNPAAIVRGGKIFVLYRAEDDSGAMAIGGHTSRLGLAESRDGIHFTRRDAPVFFPAQDDQQAREWPGGVEDPRIVESEDGTYVLTYTEWNRSTFSVGIATSRDLTHWTKHGPAFLTAEGGKYANLRYKSAGIVTRIDRRKKRLIAAKIDGNYWMYWGEGAIRLANSPDLIHWTPIDQFSGQLLSLMGSADNAKDLLEGIPPGIDVDRDPLLGSPNEDAEGAPIELLGPRPGHFDSTFPETGPPPVLTQAGIVVLYNGKNAVEGGDPALGPNAYGMGEALFDGDDPARLFSRDGGPALQPEMPYEKTGQYAAGTTFAEGLVYFHRKWFLYYGCADSLVGVVTAPGGRASALAAP